MNEKKGLEELIKEEYEERVGKKYNSHKVLSDRYQYYRNNNILYLTVENVTANMQSDDGAFDSWALVFKNWIPEIDKIVLRWERPEDVSNPHYQRFLYRVKKATTIYKPWLEVDAGCQILLNNLLIKQGNVYVVNVPKKEAQSNAANQEARIERLFVNCLNEFLANAAGMDNSVLYNQLPVGLFKDSVAGESRIFPSQNAMIDIWGVSKAKNDNDEVGELHIFELKEPNSYPIGIYSELFFYSMFEKDIIDDNFIYVDTDKVKDFRGICNLINSNCKSIKAHFLGSKIHPLIDSEMIKLINNALVSYNIQFDYIKYNIDILKQF